MIGSGGTNCNYESTVKVVKYEIGNQFCSITWIYSNLLILVPHCGCSSSNHHCCVWINTCGTRLMLEPDDIVGRIALVRLDFVKYSNVRFGKFR